jgi:hypothetical protein
MTTDALVVKSLFQIDSKLWAVAGRTTDALISLLQFALVQNVFPVFINVMAVLTGQSRLHMAVVRNRHSGSFTFSKCLQRIEYNFVWLGAERRDDEKS